MTAMNDTTQKQLRQFIEQIERLEEDRKGIVSDIKDKFLEAKSLGFDVKAMKTLLALRKKSRDQREEEQAILDLYMHAIGLVSGDEDRQEAA